MPSDEILDVQRRRAELRADFERLQAEADSMASVWTGIRMDGPDVVVLLTEPGDHLERLRALVAHPERVRVQQTRYTRAELDDVHRRAIDMVPRGSAQAHWPGIERVGLTLRSGQAALAQRLRDRFGDALAIELGRHAFPLDRASAVTAPPAPRSTIVLPGVAHTVHLDAPTHPTGEDIWGHVTIRNHGTTTLDLDTGVPAFGVLLDSDDFVVGDWNGTTTLPARPESIAPGGALSRTFVAGSDTYDPRLGASLPPGTYFLTVAVEISSRAPDGEPGQTLHRPRRSIRRRGGILATDPVPITLVAATFEPTEAGPGAASGESSGDR